MSPFMIFQVLLLSPRLSCCNAFHESPMSLVLYTILCYLFSCHLTATLLSNTGMFCPCSMIYSNRLPFCLEHLPDVHMKGLRGILVSQPKQTRIASIYVAGLNALNRSASLSSSSPTLSFGPSSATALTSLAARSCCSSILASSAVWRSNWSI